MGINLPGKTGGLDPRGVSSAELSLIAGISPRIFGPQTGLVCKERISQIPQFFPFTLILKIILSF